jgi:hypothetical protein
MGGEGGESGEEGEGEGKSDEDEENSLSHNEIIQFRFEAAFLEITKKKTGRNTITLNNTTAP